jgi:hypothetical protein
MRLPLFLVVTLALAAHGESPAVTKVLNLFNSLNQAQAAKAAGQPVQKVNFALTDAEVNEYLRHARTVNPRPGLDNMRVQFYPSNYVATLVTIDFDAVEKFRPGTVPTLLRPILSGKRAVQVDVRLQPANGATTFSVEKASFESIRIPAFVVEQMIAAVASRQKEKYDTTKPVPLPFGLRTISTDQGKVTGAN